MSNKKTPPEADQPSDEKRTKSKEQGTKDKDGREDGSYSSPFLRRGEVRFFVLPLFQKEILDPRFRGDDKLIAEFFISSTLNLLNS